MATVRLIVLLLALGIVVLLGVQNLAPMLPLVFFGGTTQALPLGIWLVGAVLLGGLTTLVLTALLGSIGGGPGNRAASYKYRPQSFYEPADAGAGPGARTGYGGSSAPDNRRNTPPSYAPPGPKSGPRSGGPPPPEDPNWRDWANLKSPGQWTDWESLSRAPRPEIIPTASASGVSGVVEGVTTWFSSSKQRAKQQQRVNESLRELDDDWGPAADRPYAAPGVSPVQDSLEDINRGWQEAEDPNRSFEAAQAPRRVYRDGSLYSYSYGGEDEPSPRNGQVDRIYAPPDDALYDADSWERSEDAPYDEGDRPDFADADSDIPLADPEMAEDGVVDADYRVIVPPYGAAAEAAATSDTWTADRPQPDPDDWDEADDALTP